MLFRSALYCSVLLCCVVLYFVFLCIAVLCRFSLGNSLGLEMIKRKQNANNKPTDREKSTVLTNKNKRARVLVGLGSAYAQDTHVLSTSRRFHRFDWSIERCIIRHMESQTPEKIQLGKRTLTKTHFQGRTKFARYYAVLYCGMFFLLQLGHFGTARLL